VRAGRLEAFSDGVIAIAATLLVIELAVPPAGEDVWHALREELPAVAAFAVSFLTILIFWVNHHALYHAVEGVNRAMLFINGLLLLAISFVSYCTAVLGHALQTGEHDRSAAVLYALVLGLCSTCFTALWICLRARPGLLTEQARPRVYAALRRSLAGPTIYLVAILVGLLNAPASLALDAVVALYFALVPRHLRKPALPPTGAGPR